VEKSNIIIVDDTKEVLSSFQRNLRKEPYNLFYASNGEEASFIYKNFCAKNFLLSSIHRKKEGKIQRVTPLHF